MFKIQKGGMFVLLHSYIFCRQVRKAYEEELV